MKKKQIVAIDCFPSKNQTEIEVSEAEFPIDYNDFCFEFHNYSYIENKFILTDKLYDANVALLEKLK